MTIIRINNNNKYVCIWVSVSLPQHMCGSQGTTSDAVSLLHLYVNLKDGTQVTSLVLQAVGHLAGVHLIDFYSLTGLCEQL